MKTQKANERIAELERKLREAEASQVHRYHFADATIDKASISRCMGSGVVISLTFLGGKEVFDPVMIRDGLSEETIQALKSDFRRSFVTATEFKPKGV